MTTFRTADELANAVGDALDAADPLAAWETRDPLRGRLQEEPIDDGADADEPDDGAPAPRRARRTTTGAAEAESVPDFDPGEVHAAFRSFEDMERVQRDDRYSFADRIATDPTFANTVVEWKAYIKTLNEEYGAGLPLDASVREVKLAVLAHNKATTAAARETATAPKPATAKRSATRTATAPDAPAAPTRDFTTVMRAYRTAMQRDGFVPRALQAEYAAARFNEFGPD